jgi:hypothetical protein
MSSRDDSRSGHRDPDWQVVEQRLYEPEGRPDLTTVVVEAVAAAEGVEATDIRKPLLYDVVDIAAVRDALFGPRATGADGGTTGSLAFEYRGLRVRVRGDGWVLVARRGE